MLLDFTEDEARTFREMLRDYQQGKSVTAEILEENPTYSPDILLARPQDKDGIHPIHVDAADPDQAGRGLCDIRRIVMDNSSNPVVLNSPDSNLEKEVFNYTLHRIPYEWFVIVRTKYGRWIPLVRDEVVQFTLTEDMGASTANEASCTIQDVWTPASEAYSGSDVGVVKDTVGIFTDATDASKGIGHFRRGDDRIIIEPYNMECP